MTSATYALAAKRTLPNVGSGGGTSIPTQIGNNITFTMYLNYTAPNTISTLYVPPGMMSNADLFPGALLSTNVGSEAIFYNLSKITLSNTTYPQLAGMFVQGYNATSNWFPIPGGNIGPTKVNYSQAMDYVMDINGINLANINGANVAVRPTAGLLTDNLATISLTFISH
jgi:hypothetical protein